VLELRVPLDVVRDEGAKRSDLQTLLRGVLQCDSRAVATLALVFVH
jgi:hypothetical protein